MYELYLYEVLILSSCKIEFKIKLEFKTTKQKIEKEAEAEKNKGNAYLAAAHRTGPLGTSPAYRIGMYLTCGTHRGEHRLPPLDPPK
jgi:hypothetical protein